MDHTPEPVPPWQYSNTTSTAVQDSLISLTSAGLPVVYTILEVCVAICAVFGNLLVIVVFLQDRRLRKVTNFYIISLSVADFLVGAMGIPSAILTRVGVPRNSLRLCLTMLSLLMVLCTVSILNLVAVSLDRYWAILYPLDYHKHISEKTAMLIILACWILGAMIGFLPLFGWNNAHLSQGKCFFIPIMNYNFLVFVYFLTIIVPAMVMAFFYIRIYAVVIHQLSLDKVRQLSLSDKPGRLGRREMKIAEAEGVKDDPDASLYRYKPTKSVSSPHQLNRLGLKGEDFLVFQYGQTSATQPAPGRFNGKHSDRFTRSCQQDQKGLDQRQWNSMVCMKQPGECECPKKSSGSFLSSLYRTHTNHKLSYNRREVSKAQKLFVIVVFFMLCWLPLYTSNTIDAFCHQCPKLSSNALDFLIILSHINSAGSPFLYAFHMKDFRGALHRLICKGAINQHKLRELRREEMFTLNGYRGAQSLRQSHSVSTGNNRLFHKNNNRVAQRDRSNRDKGCQHCCNKTQLSHRRPS